MKKMSKTVIVFIVGILVAFTIDVAAEAVISSGAVSYSNAATSETTVSGALDELFSAVDINSKIGTTDISTIGDGTITGAIDAIDDNIININNLLNGTVKLVSRKMTSDSISIASYGYTNIYLEKLSLNGYKYIGTVGYNFSNYWLTFATVGEEYLAIHNSHPNSSQTLTTDATVLQLYIKDDLV